MQSRLYSSGSETAPPFPARLTFKSPDPRRSPRGRFSRGSRYQLVLCLVVTKLQVFTFIAPLEVYGLNMALVRDGPSGCVQNDRLVVSRFRPNGVDDLLKLAKQFDFNMFHQDEEEAEDMHQQSLELLSEDIFNNDRSNASPALPSNRPPAATEKQLHPDQHMEDDLDFLFDGPTQRFSGNLSQLTQVKPPKEAPGKPEDSSHGPAAGVSGAGAKVALAKDEFEDDWENDDLLNDSLVLEMTQNPQKFCAPQHCSTQKAAGHMTHESPASAVVRSPVSNGHSRRQRTTFKLESNPGFSLGGIQKNRMVDFGPKQSVKDADQSGRFPGNGVSVEAGSRSWQTPNPVTSDPRQTEIHRRASVARYDAAASKASSTTMGRSFPTKPAPVASTAASDLPHEDLEELFSSDPVWDDEADDDLLCEICEVVENRLQGAEGAPPPGGHVTTQRASLPLSNGSQQPAYRQPFDPKRQTPGLPAVGSWTVGSASNTAAGARVTDSSQTKGPSATACGSAWTFKKPGGPVATVTVKGERTRPISCGQFSKFFFAEECGLTGGRFVFRFNRPPPVCSRWKLFSSGDREEEAAGDGEETTANAGCPKPPSSHLMAADRLTCLSPLTHLGRETAASF